MNSKHCDFMQKIIEKKGDIAPVTKLLGIELLEFREGFSKLSMTVSSKMHNTNGSLHGGLFCSLADVAFGAALLPLLVDTENFTTLDIGIKFFKPIYEGTLTANAKVVRRGKTTAYLECELLDRDILIGKCVSTYLIHSTS